MSAPPASGRLTGATRPRADREPQGSPGATRTRGLVSPDARLKLQSQFPDRRLPGPAHYPTASCPLFRLDRFYAPDPGRCSQSLHAGCALTCPTSSSGSSPKRRSRLSVVLPAAPGVPDQRAHASDRAWRGTVPPRLPRPAGQSEKVQGPQPAADPRLRRFCWTFPVRPMASEDRAAAIRGMPMATAGAEVTPEAAAFVLRQSIQFAGVATAPLHPGCLLRPVAWRNCNHFSRVQRKCRLFGTPMWRNCLPCWPWPMGPTYAISAVTVGALRSQ